MAEETVSGKSHKKRTKSDFHDDSKGCKSQRSIMHKRNCEENRFRNSQFQGIRQVVPSGRLWLARLS
jgi:hypothetical protein